MSTKFSKIYERAVFKFSDYTFLNTTTEIKESVLKQYLISSAMDFQHCCPNFDLTKFDLELEEFEEDLSDEVVEVLSLGVAYHWYKAHTFNTKLLRNVIHKSDYTSYSPANLLTSMRNLMEMTYKEYIGKMREYSYRYGNIGDLKV